MSTCAPLCTWGGGRTTSWSVPLRPRCVGSTSWAQGLKHEQQFSIHGAITLLERFNHLLYAQECWPACTSVCHTSAWGPWRSDKCVRWKWSHRWLWAIVEWVLGTEPGSSTRTERSVNHIWLRFHDTRYEIPSSWLDHEGKYIYPQTGGRVPFHSPSHWQTLVDIGSQVAYPAAPFSKSCGGWEPGSCGHTLWVWILALHFGESIGMPDLSFPIRRGMGGRLPELEVPENAWKLLAVVTMTLHFLRRILWNRGYSVWRLSPVISSSTLAFYFKWPNWQLLHGIPEILQIYAYF